VVVSLALAKDVALPARWGVDLFGLGALAMEDVVS